MFEGEAREALELYQTAFPDLKVESITEHEIAGGKTGIQLAKLVLAGQSIVLNDSSMEHEFTFTPSTSFFVDFDAEKDLDAAAETLSTDGKFLMPPGDYGFSKKFAWLSDRFGVSWQLNLP